MASEALDHVLRPPLPWRKESLTECGLDPASFQTITRDEFIAKVKDLGQKRSAMTTCMTCWDTARRWPTWEQDPPRRLSREVKWGGHGDDQFTRELYAITALIEAHREEFDDYLAGLETTVSLQERRRERRAR
ncbi:hypothetical protein ABN028_19710 [Actinopolymorpha sp. B17G11]|uniref:hypothetical protein n=1 Tax=Actinopolymorpha sp. B17G11 TaxID=3160861 RepID=UPI0032E399FD